MALNLNDKTANANHFTTNSGVAESSSVPGSLTGATISADFSRGSSDYLALSDSASLSVTGDMTVEAWINLTSLPSGSNVTHTIAGKYNGGADRSYLYGVWKNGGGTLGMIVTLSEDGSTTFAFDKAFTFSTSTWYHVAFVFTASTGTMEFFVNGSSQGTATNATCNSIFDGTADFNGGAFNNGGAEYFDGQIVDLRIWNTARTGTDITNNKDLFLVGNESGLVGNWQFQPSTRSGGAFLQNFI